MSAPDQLADALATLAIDLAYTQDYVRMIRHHHADNVPAGRGDDDYDDHQSVVAGLMLLETWLTKQSDVVEGLERQARTLAATEVAR